MEAYQKNELFFWCAFFVGGKHGNRHKHIKQSPLYRQRLFRESDYSELEGIVLPDLDGSTNRKDIRIPLLIDYIKICKKYGKVCVLELKNAFAEDDIKKVIEEIKSLEYLENVIFISFVFENCAILRRRFYHEF